MDKRFYRDAFGWGLLLWLFGYVLGIILFMTVPVGAIGWIIAPTASAVTVWVLVNRVAGSSFMYYLSVGIGWTVLAVVLDYFLIVKAFDPPDGYYKADVYLYYFLTFTLPCLVGFWKKRRNPSSN